MGGARSGRILRSGTGFPFPRVFPLGSSDTRPEVPTSIAQDKVSPLLWAVTLSVPMPFPGLAGQESCSRLVRSEEP